MLSDPVCDENENFDDCSSWIAQGINDRTYEMYGRGPGMLKYYWNYQMFGIAALDTIFYAAADITERPDDIAEDPQLGLLSALWLYMRPRIAKRWSPHEIITGLDHTAPSDFIHATMAMTQIPDPVGCLEYC